MRWNARPIAFGLAPVLLTVAVVASCTGTPPQRSATERVGVASSALSTCVRQIEPMSPAPPGGWLVLRNDGRVAATPTSPTGDFLAEAVRVVPGLLDVESLADMDGDSVTYCAVTIDHALYCWGPNDCGNLGVGSVAPSAAPLEVTGPANVIRRRVASASSGRSATCAVTVDGDLHCWGRNDHGQVGSGAATPGAPPQGCVRSPQKVSGRANVLDRAVRQVAAGFDHVCALTTTGDVYCWGANMFGQTGQPAGADTLAPTPLATLATAGRAIAIASGTEVSCALVAASATATVGEVYCWGRNRAGNDEGALGVSPSGPDSAEPLKLAWLGANVATIDVGVRSGCAVQATGQASCWGWNAFGQLGDGATANHAPGISPNGMTTGVTQVSVGSRAACAVQATSAFCWGASILPDGTAPTRTDAQALVGRTPTVSEICTALGDGGAGDGGELSGGPCETSAECGGVTPVCTSGECRRCRTDADCGGDTPACMRSGECGECSESNATRCSGDAPTCDVAEGVCANFCARDSDCGGAASGVVCDIDRCRDGCRGRDGNTCAAGMFCSSTTNEIGNCRSGTLPDSGLDVEPTGPFRFESVCSIARAPGRASSRPWRASPALVILGFVALALARRRTLRTAEHLLRARP